MKRVTKKPPVRDAYELKTGVPLPDNALFVAMENAIEEGVYVEAPDNSIIHLQGWPRLVRAAAGDTFDPQKHKLVEQGNGKAYLRDLPEGTHIVWEDGIPVPYEPVVYKNTWAEPSGPGVT